MKLLTIEHLTHCGIIYLGRPLSILLCFLVLQTIGITTPVHAGGVILIANRQVPVNQLSKREIKNIFLSKVKTLQGISVRPAMLKDSEITVTFIREELGKTPAQFSSYYRKMIFTGRARPPKKMASEADMIAFVSTNNGAIGYVSAEVLTDAVKIIQVTE